MAIPDEAFTLGVEEEYQIVDPETRQLQSDAQLILPEARATVGDQVTPEMYRSQIEIGTPVCQTLGQVRDELNRLRSELITAAGKTGNRIVAAGTHPFSHWEDQKLTRRARYRDLATDFQQLTREQLIFGCHVHVGIPDREIAIQVMNRARPWLSVLLALAGNSPFWLGTDTGYASFRTEIWGRWPTAGIPQVFDAWADYEQLVNELSSTGIIADASKIYWDVRPSSHYDTLEFRVTDVCLTVDEAVLIAGLARALARTCAWDAERYAPFRHVRTELIQAAKWQAARFGLTDQLIDVQAAQAVPARQLVDQLLTYVSPALDAYGDRKEITRLIDKVFREGNGASRQRAVFERTESLEDVVDYLITETAR
ncbi:carboxylate-amine ligase [Spirosoma lacussanchae]|uniref:carboxylate-amine ligase n=1 Tax=Spirosoma lacussanchae TaxID=1884249 RepID=UPI001FE2E0B6|nr:carboxylate-amine ligase [Spirosoma lacussanchae]